MTRIQGFARGDFDTSFPIDDKFLRLRQLVSVDRYYAAVGVYWHIVAAAWREAERKPALRICPDGEAQIADLVAADLLESDSLLKKRAFLAYVGRAKRQRAIATDRQRRNRAGMSRDVTPLSRVTNGESHDVTDPARDRVRKGKEVTPPVEGGVGGDDRDSQDRYHELTGYRPWGQFSGKALLEAERNFGRTEVIAALEAEASAGVARDELLKRAQARLARDADRLRQERAAKPKPKVQKADSRAEIRRLYAEAGMVPKGGAA